MDEQRDGFAEEPETASDGAADLPPASAAWLDETLPVVAPGPAVARVEPPVAGTDIRREVDDSAPALAVSLDETLPLVAEPASRPAPPPSRGLELLASGAGAARDTPPAAGAWRGDALAPSPHGRLFSAATAPPRDEFDDDKAGELCAAICRAALGDLAPALVLLPAPERRRAQAVAAFALTLFDFARQRGTGGERLAQINRWEFTLDAALGGERIGQPVFLRLGEEERRRPFSRDGIDVLFAAARRRATAERPANAAESEAARQRLARGLALALLGDGVGAAVVEFTAGLLGLRTLLGLGAELRGGRCPLPVDELPSILPEPPRERLAAALETETHRLEPLLLRGARAAREVPLTFRRSAAFLVLAAERLLARVEAAGPKLLTHPPRLGAFERLRLVARARWGALGRG